MEGSIILKGPVAKDPPEGDQTCRYKQTELPWAPVALRWIFYPTGTQSTPPSAQLAPGWPITKWVGRPPNEWEIPEDRERRGVFQPGWSRVPRGMHRGQASATAPETPYLEPLPTGSRARRARCASYESGTQDLPT